MSHLINNGSVTREKEPVLSQIEPKAAAFTAVKTPLTLVAEVISPENIALAFNIIDVSFPSEEDRQSAKKVLAQSLTNEPDFFDDYESRSVVLKESFIYFSEGQAAAICGLYSVPDFFKPRAEFINWFAVDPKFRKKNGTTAKEYKPISEQVIDHISTIAMSRSDSLYVYTAETIPIGKAREFYERLDFRFVSLWQRTPELQERVYCKTLTALSKHL